jgi:hypothetical protein
MSKSLLISVMVAVSTASGVHSQVVVAAPGVEARQDHKNIFDALKYAWEQAQWADKLATFHSTLTRVREQLETANLVKQAIGDPVAAIALIDNGLFSDYLHDSGIADTLTDLAGIAAEGVQLSATIQELFEPIEISVWTDVSVPFDGVSSFRDPGDPFKRFRAVENAYSRFEVLLLQARSKRQTLKNQIARLNNQLKNAKDDAEGSETRRFSSGGADGFDRSRSPGRHLAPTDGIPPSPQREPEGTGGSRGGRDQPGTQPGVRTARRGSGGRAAGFQRTELRPPVGILACPRSSTSTPPPRTFGHS